MIRDTQRNFIIFCQRTVVINMITSSFVAAIILNFYSGIWMKLMFPHNLNNSALIALIIINLTMMFVSKRCEVLFVTKMVTL